jgi:hypothetical protein
MNQTAVITGASSGIGFELARIFAADGWNLILVSRDPQRLAEAGEKVSAESGRPVEIRTCDMSDQEAAEDLGLELAMHPGGIDALVNNAGFGAHGGFVETDARVVMEMMNVNMNSLVALTRGILPGMLERKEGRILNVASVAGFAPGPLMAVYHATKAFVLSFSEALYEETRGTGVTVTALCPGPVRTNFMKRAGLEGADAFFMGPLGMDAEPCARVGYRALMRGRAIVVPGIFNKMAVLLFRFMPRALARKVVKIRQEARK